jgi:copper chaperone CopZ
MKTNLFLLVAITCISPTLWGAEDGPAVTANATNRFTITGMSCDGCAHGIASELKRTPGVVTADVAFSNKLAVVAYDTNRVSTDGLKKVIVEAGYEAKLIKPRKAKQH